MAHLSAAPAAIDTPGHNLRFLNEEWNDSISNGLSFTLRWNQSLERDKTELGLFRIRYPQEGVVVYDLVTNLTGSTESESCTWIPEGLGHDLYAIWLSTGQHAHPNWTVSPPWTQKEESKSGLHWATRIGVPLICLLVLYGICLSIYLLHRRRRREKREKEDATPHQDVIRNNSVASEVSVQTHTDTDGGNNKSSIWLVTHSSQTAHTEMQRTWKSKDGPVDTRGAGHDPTGQSPV